MTIKLQKELHNLFDRGGFLLHKCNPNEPSVLQYYIDPKLRDLQDTQEISDTKQDSWSRMAH